VFQTTDTAIGREYVLAPPVMLWPNGCKDVHINKKKKKKK